ncbi:TetR/AcrR family transcriptional regulator [uncultured Treponema sp.]|uniref:TetR/AcrR family transcriptional regulator n=1 Tax=uncultured Treponema sp. TaxID=162155 RepID=UPI0025E85557|nr:TetR/AcrR family transcriptional regulator [uncultured Treponema sp.]
MAKTEKVNREKIILAFLDACFTKNAGGTSLSDVAEKLGIKKASLYNHYESRDAMIEDCLRWCGDYYRKTYFIPTDIDSISQRYPAENVMKAIVNRWFKMNEKEPLIQIYSFIESEKYISTAAAKIAQETREKLVTQTKQALRSLAKAGKIIDLEENDLNSMAQIMTSITISNLDDYIVSKKIEIRSNPETGADSLFKSTIEPDYSRIDALVNTFCSVLK